MFMPGADAFMFFIGVVWERGRVKIGIFFGVVMLMTIISF